MQSPGGGTFHAQDSDFSFGRLIPVMKRGEQTSLIIPARNLVAGAIVTKADIEIVVHFQTPWRCKIEKRFRYILQKDSEGEARWIPFSVSE